MRSVNHILCALDLSNQSALVAEYATTLALTFKAKVTAVYVTPLLTQFLGVNVSAKSIDKLASELGADGENALKEFVDEHFQGVETAVEVVSGYPADEIVALAEKAGVDLIVMGTHGHQGINRILFGSVAEGVVKSSPVPVLTVHPPQE